jgi:hypothetical protein
MDQLTFNYSNYSYDEKISNSKPYTNPGQTFYTLIIVVFEQTYAFCMIFSLD